MSSYFSSLTSQDMAKLIAKAETSVCFAAPGMQTTVADAIAQTANRIGSDLITVCVDFDERVLRMGYGDLDAIKKLQAAGITTQSSPNLRMGLLVVDDEGFVFTPTALLLEAENHDEQGMNAMRLAPLQAKEAMARLSPAAKAVALVMAKSEEERQMLEAIVTENVPSVVPPEAIEQTAKAIQAVPLTKFDVARQVRVYNTFLQYVEIELRNASIDKKRLAIPPEIQALGGGQELDGRLKSSFDLIDRNSSISSKPLNDKVAKLRKDFTPSLGKKFGRALLKSAKPKFEERIAGLKGDLKEYQNRIKAEIQEQLDSSKDAISEHYLPLAQKNLPDAAIGLFGEAAKSWLIHELDKAFPKADDLIKNMNLEVDYKDVTFETLQDAQFLEAVRHAFPGQDWDKAHVEFNAVGEADKTTAKKLG